MVHLVHLVRGLHALERCLPAPSLVVEPRACRQTSAHAGPLPIRLWPVGVADACSMAGRLHNPQAWMIRRLSTGVKVIRQSTTCNPATLQSPSPACYYFLLAALPLGQPSVHAESSDDDCHHRLSTTR